MGPPVVPYIFVSHLVKQFKQDSQYTANLHAFNKSTYNRTGQAGLSRTWLVLTNDTETPEIKAMLEKIVEHINKGPWEVDLKLLTVICLLCQEFLYQADRTNYTSLWHDVMAHLWENKDRYKLAEYQICTSFSAKKFLSLGQFTTATACKYKHVGGSEQLHINYTQHNANWQCFAFDNTHLMQQKSTQNIGEATLDASNSEEESIDISQKHNYTSSTNFWEALQKYLTKKIALHGTNFENDLWAT
ncbi:hypothetical protein IW262DRAFT_1296976 [Armillaria fumosa]|nr:hypothetical protein IW262DRAFT_1296976 [Armillaria fumosa]